MLKGVDPILSPALLSVLRAMGHGDEIAIVDANFPATACARRVIRLDGVAATRALEAVVSVMPLDDFEAECAWRMDAVGAPDAEQPIYAEFRAVLQSAAGKRVKLAGLERHAFYERARSAFAIIATGETRLYGNILLKKGVVRADNPATRVDIDAHQHFWSLARGDYGWLTPALASIHRDFGPQHLAPHLRRHGIAQSVLVQGAPTDGETAYLLDIADQEPSVAAVTGWVDFTGDAAALHRLARHAKLRAVRPMLQDIADPAWILQAQCQPMLETLGDLGLAFEFLGKPRHLDATLALVDRYPRMTMILNHAMKPDIADGAFEPWASRMRDLACRPNTICKLSGLVTEAGPDWTLGQIARYVRHIVETFGASRVMWGSDWPVVNLAGGYDAWRAASLALVDSRTEAPAIFGGTAAQVYRLGAPRAMRA